MSFLTFEIILIEIKFPSLSLNYLDISISIQICKTNEILNNKTHFLSWIKDLYFLANYLHYVWKAISFETILHLLGPVIDAKI